MTTSLVSASALPQTNLYETLPAAQACFSQSDVLYRVVTPAGYTPSNTSTLYPVNYWPHGKNSRFFDAHGPYLLPE